MKLSHLLLSLVLLTGCSVLDTVKGVADIALGEQPALSVDAQIGDKTSNIGKTDNSTIEVGDNEGNLTVTSTKSDKSFAKTEKVIINEGPDIFWGILLVLGWLLPTPNQLFSGFKSWKQNRQCLISPNKD